MYNVAMLDKKKKYLQVALNGTLSDAANIISVLPVSDRIIIEAGTPFIKSYGMEGIRNIVGWWSIRTIPSEIRPYVVADLKCMDRGATEVRIARAAGASAAVVLGQAPLETINVFIETCKDEGIDSMVDMMGIDQPIKVLRHLKKPPSVVVLHRGVDEEAYNKSKPIPYIHINKVRATMNVMISLAGGDTIREVQRAVFNDADIVVVWKEFYQADENTAKLAEEFLQVIK